MNDNPSKPAPPATPTHDRPGGVNGLWFIGLTLSLFVIVPAIVIGVSRMASQPKDAPELVYAERDTWQPQELRPRQLEYDMFVAAETGRQYRKANFPLHEAEEAMLHQAVQIAQRDDFFDSEEILDHLMFLAHGYTDQFYPCYLAAEWLRVNGREDEADLWRDQCFRRATGAIVQQLVYDDGTPAAGHTLPPVAIAYDRVIDGQLDTTLMLVYPAPAADEHGRVYLPTFESIYRLTDPALPPGAATGSYPRELTLLPQDTTRQTPNWFSAPYRVGQLPDAVVDDPAP